jgi:putative endonuclease
MAWQLEINQLAKYLPLKHSDAMDWTVYIILCDDQSLYTGVTTDIQRRFSEHLGGGAGAKRGAKYFNGRKPLEIVYTEPGHNRSSACQREWAIKRLNRKEKLDLVDKTT